jgi:hypothetical protein
VVDNTAAVQSAPGTGNTARLFWAVACPSGLLPVTELTTRTLQFWRTRLLTSAGSVHVESSGAAGTCISQRGCMTWRLCKGLAHCCHCCQCHAAPVLTLNSSSEVPALYTSLKAPSCTMDLHTTAPARIQHARACSVTKTALSVNAPRRIDRTRRNTNLDPCMLGEKSRTTLLLSSSSKRFSTNFNDCP